MLLFIICAVQTQQIYALLPISFVHENEMIDLADLSVSNYLGQKCMFVVSFVLVFIIFAQVCVYFFACQKAN